MYMPQLAGVLSARATLDVLNTIAAVTLTSAHANSEQLVIILISFVFIFMFLSIEFSCSGLLWLLIMRSHFWPFTGVQNGNQREVMGKMQKP